MSKEEFEQLTRTLQSQRQKFELRQLALGIAVTGEESRSRFAIGANIEDFQRKGSLVDMSQYRRKS